MILFWFYFTNRSQSNYSMSKLTEDIEKDQVTSITIQQNREVPTGEVDVTLKNKDTRYFYLPAATDSTCLTSRPL